MNGTEEGGIYVASGRPSKVERRRKLPRGRLRLLPSDRLTCSRMSRTILQVQGGEDTAASRHHVTTHEIFRTNFLRSPPPFLDPFHLVVTTFSFQQ